MRSLILMLSFIPHFLLGQAKEKVQNSINQSFLFTNRFGVNIGLANPVGEFGQSGGTDPKEGFALSGLNIEANYTHMFDKNIGFTAALGRSSYKFNETDLERLASAFTPSGVSTRLSIDNYRHFYYTLGFKVSFGDITKFYFNPVIGGSIFTFGEQNITASGRDQNGQPLTVNTVQFEDEDGALIYGINAGFDSFIEEDISINFNIQYYSREYEYDGFIQSTPSNNTPPTTVLNSYDVAFKTLNVTLGIGYHFN